jgi:hypothetical protein
MANDSAFRRLATIVDIAQPYARTVTTRLPSITA